MGNRKQRRELDKTSANILERLKKAEKQAGVCAITYMGVQGGQFAGGMVGRPDVILEALYHGAKKNVTVAKIIHMVSDVLKKEDIRDKAKQMTEELSVSKLFDDGFLTQKLYNILSNEEILNLVELEAFTEKEFKSLRGVGAKTFKEVEALMITKQLKFKEA